MGVTGKGRTIIAAPGIERLEHFTEPLPCSLLLGLTREEMSFTYRLLPLTPSATA